MTKNKYTFTTFKDLYDNWICYAYESQHGAFLGSTAIGLEYAMINKLTIYSDGGIEYKGHYDTYDPRLWPKVKALVELLQETKAEKILFSLENKKSPQTCD